MKTNKKISIAFIAFNVFGVISSLCYGMFGGTGGETTQGVYLGLFYTNIISILLGIVLILVRFSWWRSNFGWAILILLIYYPVTSVVITNKINNYKDKKTVSTDFGLPSSQKYAADKNQAEAFLKKEKKENFSIDTLVYSRSLLRILIICSIKDSSGVYKNFEMFAVNSNRLLFNFPKGGNLISEDLNKSNLMKKVLEWYVNTFSTNEKDIEGLWHYQDFWQQ